MKNLSKTVGIIIVIIGAIFYGAQTFLDIDLLSFVIPDTEAPVIDVSNLRTSVTVDGTYDTSGVSCEDNRDITCEVTIVGSIDTSTIGEQTITIIASDLAGNATTETITVMIIEGLDTTTYIPVGYYDSASGLTGEALKDALNDIITNHIEFPYTSTNTDVWDLLRDADEDPDNPDNVIMFYSGFSWPKECQDTNTDLLPDDCFESGDREADYTEWNREHIWSKSHGDFDEDPDMSGGYSLGAHTDAHHLVAAERAMNSTKNNRFFDDCHDGINDTDVEDRGFGNYTCGEWFFEPRDEVKGDVARMLFYMAVRYEGETGDFVDLELAEDLKALAPELHLKDNHLPYYGNLVTLLRWHIEDPVDEWEIERNEAIFQFQGNRNPFIDHPEWVALIWGTADNPVEFVSISIEE
jgi:endonuclease I